MLDWRPNTDPPVMQPVEPKRQPERFTKDRLRELTADVKAVPREAVREVAGDWRALRDAITEKLPPDDGWL